MSEKNSKKNSKNNIYDNLDREHLINALNNANEHINDLDDQIEEMQNQINELAHSHHSVFNSVSWRITKPMRMVSGPTKRVLKTNALTRYPYRALTVLKNEGIKSFAVKIKRRLKKKIHPNKNKPTMDITIQERDMQTSATFSRNVKFSVVVPLYNTPEKFLTEMIDSVINQTYKNWELCITDGSDDAHAYVGDICKTYATNDNRIIYKKLEENLGISDNTNAAIAMASGDFIGLFDHDDLLHPSALYYYAEEIENSDPELLYCDETTFIGKTSKIIVTHYKPDFAIDNLRAYNYICHFTVIKRELLDRVGLLDRRFDGSQDHDFILRLSENTNRIAHIPRILYFWRNHPNSVSMDINSKIYAIQSGIDAVTEHLKRQNIPAKVKSSTVFPTIYKINYTIQDFPLISIIIPNKDQVKVLKKCIESILRRSTYLNYEIIIVENNSVKTETFAYYKSLEREPNIKVVTWEHEFNYSKINNFGAQFASGEQLILLNNDIEVISRDWMEQMLMLNQRDDVAITGAKLYYPNNTIQHAGVILGLGGFAGHVYVGAPRIAHGYMARLQFAQNLSVVTAACLMVKRSVFDEINGLDEQFKVALNDVDFCMRARKAGHLVCWTPHAELYHHESISRGYEDSPEKIKRFNSEVALFKDRWKKELEAGDPYYNKNFYIDPDIFNAW